ncbi:hypothetical protein RRG08_017166 [Elysia crispata]|uniref:Uncharacterized protein n=1 Tax=Elysia crispata TaxID=231223 RepID=A0AAE1B3H6_9GAST|nr:hypothetical protein RRG08_017166 [Elysia crispata]
MNVRELCAAGSNPLLPHHAFLASSSAYPPCRACLRLHCSVSTNFCCTSSCSLYQLLLHLFMQSLPTSAAPLHAVSTNFCCTSSCSLYQLLLHLFMQSLPTTDAPLHAVSTNY